MPKRKSYNTLHERVLARPGAEARIARHRADALAEMGLYELRLSQQISQVELAGRLEVTQPSISKIEHARDVRLSTLKEYVEALGGHLELRVRFDEDRVVRLDLKPRE